jgi:tetratricopeptide (TPR) repeat protein
MKRILSLAGVFLALLLDFGCAGLDKSGSSEAAAGVSFYVGQASVAIKEKEYDRAIDNLDRALAINPDNPEALNLAGMARFFKKDYKIAEANFAKAISLSPSYASALNNLGNLYFMTGRLEKAEELLKKALEISPRLASAYYSLGALLLQVGRTDEAITYLTKGLDLDPSYLDSHKSLIASTGAQGSAESEFAWARVYASRGDVEKTLVHLESAKRAGFSDWKRIESDKAFNPVRENPDILRYVKSR